MSKLQKKSKQSKSSRLEEFLEIIHCKEDLLFLGKNPELNALAATQPIYTHFNKIIRKYPYNKSHNIKWIYDAEIEKLMEKYPQIDKEAFEDNFTYLNSPEGICCKDNYVYITDTDNCVIKVYTISGEFIKIIGLATEQPLVNPTSVSVSAKNEVIVGDTSLRRIVIYDLAGNFIRMFGSSSNGVNQFSNRFVISTYNDIENSNQTYIFVSDQQNNRIMKFDSDGNFLKQWGTYGREVNQFNMPKGIFVSNDQKVYVCDYSNHRIQMFDLEGNFIKIFAPGNFVFPNVITVSEQGEVYVCDGDIPTDDSLDSNFRLQVFNQQGRRIKIVDIQDSSTYFANHFTNAEYKYVKREYNVIVMGICLTNSNDIIISDWHNNELYVHAAGCYNFFI